MHSSLLSGIYCNSFWVRIIVLTIVSCTNKKFISLFFFSFFCDSLRNNMFELADRLVGIYKTDNCTKSITINPGCFADGSEVAS